MRITGGKAARRLLKVPKGFDVRPTPDLVKQAVFNSLGERVVDAQVLELFAGTGALSLDCLSRGAAAATCIEKSHRHAEVLRQNAEAAGFAGHTVQVRAQEVFTVLPHLRDEGKIYDLIIADPPYGEKNVGRRSTSLAQKLIDDPALPDLLRVNGLFILGHTKRDTLEISPPWEEQKILRHGDSIMRFLRRKMTTVKTSESNSEKSIKL